MYIKKIEIENIIDEICYIIYNENFEAIIIDPGGSKEKIQTFVNEYHLNVLAILITHAHVDHILALDCFDVPIYISKIEFEKQLKSDYQNRCLMWEKCFNIKKSWNYEKLNIVELEQTQIFEISNFEIRSYMTNGHSYGDLSYVINSKYMFLGDCLSKYSTGRFDYPNESDLRKCVSSILFIIRQFDDNMICFPSHNESFILKEVFKYNKFVKLIINLSDEELIKWISLNNIQLANFNEYSKKVFGFSISELKKLNEQKKEVEQIASIFKENYDN